MQDPIVIVDAKRTAIGKFQGSLANIPAANLGAVVIRALLEHNQLDARLVSEVIMGQVLQTGCGQNPARQAALSAGIDISTPAHTINKVCGSGMQAVHTAAQALQIGDADIIIAGGQENMSLAPYFLKRHSTRQKLGHIQFLDSLLHDGLHCAIEANTHMGNTAENLAKRYRISRKQQDDFAYDSQVKASRALKNGAFAAEIVPVRVHTNEQISHFEEDEFVRKDMQRQQLSQLHSAFQTKGTVTAGNASGINDAAAALLLMRYTTAQQLGLTPMAKITAYASCGVEPKFMGIAPVLAIHKCLQKANIDIQHIDYFELNEAFAAQVLAVMQQLQINAHKVNHNGGAIALGHPIGASGARILTSLVHHMRQYNYQRGIAAMCIGGGQGIATLVEQI